MTFYNETQYQDENADLEEDSMGSEDMEDDNSQQASSCKDGGAYQHNKGHNGGRSYSASENGNYERVIRKRKRKSGDQLKTLMREFDRNPNWTKETLLEVSRKTGLSEAQVYKWGWD